MIDTAALAFALGAGLVAALNPCGFALLPGYLALVIASAQKRVFVTRAAEGVLQLLEP